MRLGPEGRPGTSAAAAKAVLTTTAQVYFTIKQVDLKDEKVDIDFEGGNINFTAGEYALDLKVIAAAPRPSAHWSAAVRGFED